MKQTTKNLWTTTTWILTCRRCRSMIIRYHGNLIVNFDSERGGISLEQEKSETGTTSRLLLTKATFRDSGNYSCVPLGALSASVIVHVLNGNWKRLFFHFTRLLFFLCCSSTFHIHSVIFSRPVSTLSSLIPHELVIAECEKLCEKAAKGRAWSLKDECKQGEQCKGGNGGGDEHCEDGEWEERKKFV